MKNLVNGMGIDTAVVLLFLAMEVGRYGSFGSPETLLMVVTLIMLLVLPYFLPALDETGPSFAKWLVFRAVVMFLGLFLGLNLPESMKFLPMNFVILAGICSCFVQFYGLMKLRLAD